MENKLKSKFVEEIIKSLNKIRETSNANKRKVGAIVLSGNYLYHGYNRMFDNSSCENKNGESMESVIHAEEDAIISHFKCEPTTFIENNPFSSNKILFCTYSPCMNCAKLIVHAGIDKLVYIDKHKVNFDTSEHKDGISVKDFLISRKVEVIRIDSNCNIIE